MSLRSLLGLSPSSGRHAAPRGRREQGRAVVETKRATPAPELDPVGVTPPAATEPPPATSTTVRLGFADGSEVAFDEGSREWQALHVVAATLING